MTGSHSWPARHISDNWSPLLELAVSQAGFMKLKLQLSSGSPAGALWLHSQLAALAAGRRALPCPLSRTRAGRATHPLCCAQQQCDNMTSASCSELVSGKALPAGCTLFANILTSNQFGDDGCCTLVRLLSEARPRFLPAMTLHTMSAWELQGQPKPPCGTWL